MDLQFWKTFIGFVGVVYHYGGYIGCDSGILHQAMWILLSQFWASGALANNLSDACISPVKTHVCGVEKDGLKLVPRPPCDVLEPLLAFKRMITIH